MKLASRSIEIVNATLLEVFVVLSFIVMAVLASKQADFAEARKSWATERGALEKRAEVAERLVSLHQGQFVSHLKPACGGVLEPIIEFRLIGDDRIAASAKRMDAAAFGWQLGNSEMLAVPELEKRLAPIAAYNSAKSCKFYAQMVDAPAISKNEFKRIRKSLLQFFYVNVSG